MKAFEKWFENHDEYWKTRKEWAESAWKAALGLVYDKLDYSQEHEDIKDIIEEALK